VYIRIPLRKSSNRFGRNEVAQAIYCLTRAYAAIMKKSTEDEEVSSD